MVRATRGLAVDGDEVVPTRPQCVDPALETNPEGQGIHPVYQGAQPAFTGDSVVERGEPSKQTQMMLAPGGYLVEIVARGDRGAGQKQQHLGQGIDDPPWLAVIRKLGKMLQQQSHARPGNILIGEKLGWVVHRRLM